MGRLLLVPGIPALTQRYSSASPAFDDVKTAVGKGLCWLAEPTGSPRTVTLVHRGLTAAEQSRGLAAPVPAGIGRELLAQAGLTATSDQGSSQPGQWPGLDGSTSLLAIANGSACRTEKAPGFFDERAEGFDDAVAAGLQVGSLAGIDLDLGQAVWAEGLAELAVVLAAQEWRLEQLWFDAAPVGVQYWVAGFTCGS